MNIQIETTNVGRTPASGVRGAAVIFGPEERVITKDDLQFVCNRAYELPTSDRDSASAMVFPGGTDYISAQAVDYAAYTDDYTPRTQAILGGPVSLVYCISYFNAGKEPVRHTGEALVLTGFKMGSILKDGEEVAPSDLQLGRTPFDLKWRSYAD